MAVGGQVRGHTVQGAIRPPPVHRSSRRCSNASSSVDVQRSRQIRSCTRGICGLSLRPVPQRNRHLHPLPVGNPVQLLRARLVSVPASLDGGDDIVDPIGGEVEVGRGEGRNNGIDQLVVQVTGRRSGRRPHPPDKPSRRSASKGGGADRQPSTTPSAVRPRRTIGSGSCTAMQRDDFDVAGYHQRHGGAYTIFVSGRDDRASYTG